MSMHAQEFQDPEQVSTIWVKILNIVVYKMNNTKSSMIEVKWKNAITLDTVPLSKTYPQECVLRLGWIVEEQGNRVLYYLKDGPHKAFLSE